MACVVVSVIITPTIIVIFLLTTRYIKLYTQRTTNINNPPSLPLHKNEDYNASCLFEEDDNFPGYVKLSLTEVKANYLDLIHYTIMNDGKLYLSNSVILNSCCEQ